jgi:hypothetical protein
MAKRASAASADTASSFESEVLCKCQRRSLESADTVIALRTDQIARAVGAVLAQQRKHQKQAQQVAAAGGAVA